MVKTINICRCCLNIGCYRDISTEYFWYGEIEVYEQMLLNTFDLQISYQKGGGPNSCSRLICEECIKKLREATEFKNQVLRNEREIGKFLSEILDDHSKETNQDPEENISLNLIKENTHQQPETNINNDADNEFLNHSYTNNDYDLVVQIEDDDNKDDNDDLIWNDNVETDSLVSKTTTEQLASSGIIDTGLNGNATYERTGNKPTIKKQNPGDTNIEQLASSDEIPTVLLSDLKDTTTLEPKRKKPRTAKKKPDNEGYSKFRKMATNTINILCYSKGAVLFLTRQNWYQCFLCKREYVGLRMLRDHMKEHPLKTITKTIKKLKTYRNVDISELSCRLCDTKQNGLEELTKHLTEKHDVEFTNDGNLLVPFKSENGLNCVICNQQFERLCILKNHMNTHYAYHDCKLCGDSFINPIQLYCHNRNAHTQHKCVECSELFDTRHLLIKHKKHVHNVVRDVKYHCRECSGSFEHHYLLKIHRIEKHGWKKPVTSDCKLCDRKFDGIGILNQHVRKVHLKEKNYSCDLCAAKFFSKCDVARHRLSHSDEWTFQCDHCIAKFKGKDVLRRHIVKLHMKKNSKKILSSCLPPTNRDKGMDL